MEKHEAIKATINPTDPSGTRGIKRPLTTSTTFGFTSIRVIINATSINPTNEIITFSSTL